MKVIEIKASEGNVLTLRDREGKTSAELPCYKAVLMCDPNSLEEMTQEEFDAIGKVVQTIEGKGTMADPYKGWAVGQSVEAGKWYLVPDPTDPDNPYLWEAIADGIPTSETDTEFFDVVGL